MNNNKEQKDSLDDMLQMLKDTKEARIIEYQKAVKKYEMLAMKAQTTKAYKRNIKKMDEFMSLIKSAKKN